MTVAFDIASLPEDDRIRVMGESAASGKVVGFFVETRKKAARYIRKLEARHACKLIDQVPTNGAILVRIGPKATH